MFLHVWLWYRLQSSGRRENIRQLRNIKSNCLYVLPSFHSFVLLETITIEVNKPKPNPRTTEKRKHCRSFQFSGREIVRRRKGTIFARHLSDIVQVRKCTSCSSTDGYWDKLTRFYSTKNSCGKNITPGKKIF